VYGIAYGTSAGTNYGLYGTANNGAVNWGIYTPDNANLGSSTINRHRFHGWMQAGSVSDDHRILPFSGDWGYVGDPTNYWYRMFANTYFGLDTSIQTFTPAKTEDDLENMTAISHVDPKTGQTMLIFDPQTLPAFIKGKSTPEQPNGDTFIDVMKTIGYTLTKLKQFRTELNSLEEVVAGKDADTGSETVEKPGLESTAVVSGADEAADGSVSDYQTSPGVGPRKENGEPSRERPRHKVPEMTHNVARNQGSVEFQPVSENVAPGDVLVIDRFFPGQGRACNQESDRAVIGVVSRWEDVSLETKLDVIADLYPDLIAQLDEARSRGDQQNENDVLEEIDELFVTRFAAVTYAGTVACKVDASYSPIAIGDLLVTSPTVGHAMKSDYPEPGTVIGKALEPLDTGSGSIRILVMMR